MREFGLVIPAPAQFKILNRPIGKAASGGSTETGTRASSPASGTRPARSRKSSSSSDGRRSRRGSSRTGCPRTDTSRSAEATPGPGAAREPARPTAEGQRTRHSSCQWATLVLVRSPNGETGHATEHRVPCPHRRGSPHKPPMPDRPADSARPAPRGRRRTPALPHLPAAQPGAAANRSPRTT